MVQDLTWYRCSQFFSMDFRFSCAVGTVVVSPALAAMLIAWQVEEEGREKKGGRRRVEEEESALLGRTVVIC